MRKKKHARSLAIAVATTDLAAYRVIADLPHDLSNLYLTFVSDEGVSTFARDNAEHLPDWWVVLCAKLMNPGREGFSIGLVKREFTALKDTTTGLPIKKISGARFEHRGAVVKLSAAETRLCCTTGPDGCQATSGINPLATSKTDPCGGC
jgi:hypothetical protein